MKMKINDVLKRIQLMPIFLFFSLNSSFAKTIKEALDSTGKEMVGAGDNLIYVVLVVIGLAMIMHSKTRQWAIRHIPWVIIGALILYSAKDLMTWIKRTVS